MRLRVVSDGLIASALGLLLAGLPTLMPRVKADERIRPASPNDCLCNYAMSCPSSVRWTCVGKPYCSNCTCEDLSLGEWTCIS